MLTDYSDLEQEISDAPELKVLPRGTEVEARVVGHYSGENEEHGTTWHRLVFDVPDEPLVAEFQSFIPDLDDKELLTDKQWIKAVRRFKLFAECFGLDYARPFDWDDDIVGLTGRVVLGFQKSDEYGEQNTLSKFLAKK